MKNSLSQSDYSTRHINKKSFIALKPDSISMPGKKKRAVAYVVDFKSPQIKNRNNRSLKKFHHILSCDKKMYDIFEDIENVAEFDFPVHICGETGTGKELVAKAIHDQSKNKVKPFVTVNCGALPEGILESELFGHEKGAFSGAIKSRKGRFELADGGTIFLDEVAELTASAQVKLLRVIQEGIIEKVGSETFIPVNVRIISATNKILKNEISNGNFRKDLYYRLNVFPMILPPLYKRKKDIVKLASHFINEVCKRYNKSRPVLSNPVCELFEQYPWPGNIRELQNIICFSVVKNRSGIITVDDLPLEFQHVDEDVQEENQTGKLNFDKVENALLSTGWNKSQAAKKLNIGRATLYRFLHQNDELMRKNTK